MSKIRLREKRAVFATLTTMIKLFRFLQIHLALAICEHADYGIRNKAEGSNYSLKYSNFAYFAFSSIQFPLQLDFRFKKRKEDGMLFYIDDQGIKESMDAFLLNSPNNGQMSPKRELFLTMSTGIELF